MQRGFAFLKCPDCARKGVSLKLQADDLYSCRYCEWYAYIHGNYPADKARLEALKATNPKAEILS